MPIKNNRTEKFIRKIHVDRFVKHNVVSGLKNAKVLIKFDILITFIH